MPDVLQMLEPRVVRGHAEHLVVTAHLVLHPIHSDLPAEDEAAGERRLLQQDQRVEWIPVRAQRFFDEPVVRRILRGREQRAVQPDAAGLVIHLVFVPPPFGDLDGDVELHVNSVPKRNGRLMRRAACATTFASPSPLRSSSCCLQAPVRRTSSPPHITRVRPSTNRSARRAPCRCATWRTVPRRPVQASAQPFGVLLRAQVLLDHLPASSSTRRLACSCSRTSRPVPCRRHRHLSSSRPLLRSPRFDRTTRSRPVSSARATPSTSS